MTAAADVISFNDDGWAVGQERIVEILWKNTNRLAVQKYNSEGIYFDKVLHEEEDNTLLHKDKDLSTSRLFHKSVPRAKHSNAQYK